MEFILSMSLGINLLLFIFTIRILKIHFANIFLLALLSIVLMGTGYVILINYFSLQNTFISHLINSLPSLIGSFTYLYVYYSVYSIKKIRLKSFFHALPLLFAIPLSYYEGERITVISIILEIGLKVIVSIVYFILSLNILNKYKRNIKNHFSKTDNFDLKWLEFVVIMGLILYLIYLFIMFIWAFHISMFHNIETFPNYLTLVYILSLSYYSLSSTKVFVRISSFNTEHKINYLSEKTDALEVNIDKKELMTSEKAKQVFEDIKIIMDKKQLFKNENFKIEDLASEMEMHSKYISYVINSVEGKNFFDFINKYRVKEFNSEILKPQNNNLTYLSIAFDCGFGSKSTFNRAYKNEMGYSPTEFIKRQKVKLN